MSRKGYLKQMDSDAGVSTEEFIVKIRVTMARLADITKNDLFSIELD